MGLIPNRVAIVDQISRIGAGAVFAVSGLVKLNDIGSFHSSVRSFDMIPPEAVPLFASLIILAEVACGTALIYDLRRKAVTSVLFFMMAIFTIAVVKQYWSGGEGSCGCFGEYSAGAVDGWTLVRNAGLLLLLIRLNRMSKSKDLQNSNQPVH